MFQRQKSGSIVCPACGRLVGVNEKACPYCGRTRPGLWGFARSVRDRGQELGFPELVMTACGLLFLACLAVDPSAMFQGGLMRLLSPGPRALMLFGATGVLPVVGQGHWWTLLAAGWLHAGILHLGFNLFALRSLGPLVSQLYGPGRFMISYTVATVAGFFVSTLAGWAMAVDQALGGSCLLTVIRWVLGPHGLGITLGASAGICGLVGAAVYYGRRGGSSSIGGQAKSWMFSIVVFGILIQGIDNWAHLGGFAGGYLASKALDPLKPERTDHLIAAIVCLLLSAAAIGASIVVGLKSL